MVKKIKKKIRIVFADDEPLARAGIRGLLSQAEDFKIIGEAQDGFEAQQIVPLLRPDILLLDYQMPGPGAYMLEKWVRENYPETTVLVLTAHNQDAYLAKVMESGAAGFLLKNEKADQLLNAIRRAATGTVGYTVEQITRVRKWKQEVAGKWESLSPREQEVLRQVVMGKENKAIADSLEIALKTVEFHITNILKKLHLKSRDEAIIWMLNHRPDHLAK